MTSLPFPLPRFELWSIFDYVLFGLGISIGSVLWAEPMAKIQQLIGDLRK